MEAEKKGLITQENTREDGVPWKPRMREKKTDGKVSKMMTENRTFPHSRFNYLDPGPGYSRFLLASNIFQTFLWITTKYIFLENIPQYISLLLIGSLTTVLGPSSLAWIMKLLLI